jgi:hypothetical protein
MTVLGGTLFSYLSAFITIVVALAMTDMFLSLHRLIRARGRVRWRPVPIGAALVIYLTLLTQFFELWRFTERQEMSFYTLAVSLSEPLLVFIAAAAVLPDEVPVEGIDLDRFYMDERVYIWTAVLLSGFANLLINLMDRPERFTFATYDGLFYLSVSVLLIGFNVPLIWSRRRAVHALCIAGMLVTAHYGFSHWSISGLPATSAG